MFGMPSAPDTVARLVADFRKGGAGSHYLGEFIRLQAELTGSSVSDTVDGRSPGPVSTNQAAAGG